MVCGCKSCEGVNTCVGSPAMPLGGQHHAWGRGEHVRSVSCQQHPAANGLTGTSLSTEKRSDEPKLVPYSELKPSNQIKGNKGKEWGGGKRIEGLDLFLILGRKSCFMVVWDFVPGEKKILHTIVSTIWPPEGYFLFFSRSITPQLPYTATERQTMHVSTAFAFNLQPLRAPHLGLHGLIVLRKDTE